jgi:hypothetical protein
MRILLQAFGKIQPLEDWQNDPRCSVTHDTLLARVEAGWLAQTAIETLPSANDPVLVKPEPPCGFQRPPKRTDVYECFGAKKTLEEWLNVPRCQIDSAKAIEWRLKQGWTVRQAITTPPATLDKPMGFTRPERSERYKAFGKKQTLQDWAKDPRCPLKGSRRYVTNVIRNRIKRLGWTVEDAITKPARHTRNLRRKTYRAYGKELTLIEWLKEPECMPTTTDTITRRLAKGMSFENALKVKPQPAGGAKPLYEVDGVAKPLSEWVRHPDCAVASTQTIRVRIQRGFSVKDAIFAPLRCEDEVY